MDFFHLLQILLLAIVQGAAELLPVSSSAHVTIVARLIGYDMSNVFEWTFLLVMLHTGTMFSVLVYFWSRWKRMLNQWRAMVLATIATGVVGYPLMVAIKHVLNLNGGTQTQEIEHLFLNLPLMACSLAVVGVLIIIAGRKDELLPGTAERINLTQGTIIGAVQGLALPFRGFSRSGSTISAGLLLGIVRARAEEFSFALAVIITPVVIAREVWMLIKETRPGDASFAGAGKAAEHRPVAVAGAIGHGVQLRRRTVWPMVVIGMVGAWPLEVVWVLLFGCCGSRSDCVFHARLIVAKMPEFAFEDPVWAMA